MLFRSTVILKGPVIGGCSSELKGNIAVTAAGVQTYTLPLSGFSLQTPCGFATAAQALQNRLSLTIVRSDIERADNRRIDRDFMLLDEFHFIPDMFRQFFRFIFNRLPISEIGLSQSFNHWRRQPVELPRIHKRL